ncbi:MAG: non-hydrolyzing UDP-N-acetylglucosamine 2-epimerase [Bacteriovoracaceae bacterium]
MKITAIFGTRPESIKLAPFILEGRNRGHEVTVAFTGQHREMALPLLDFFKIKPDIDLNLMRPNQSLTAFSAHMLSTLNELPASNTDAVVVQGDTTSCFVGAYWAFLNKIPVIHLEAGLRTNNIYSPFPEEANRQLVGRISHVHLAPTDDALKALHAEGIFKNTFMIGNTGLDALRIVSEQVNDQNLPQHIRSFISDKKVILITSHRRENFGEGMKQIASALKTLSLELPDIRFVFPVHLNPNVRQVMMEELKGLENLLLTDPVDYLPFVALMKRSSVIVTDSGGIQEEAPSLRVPVIVMRDSTERPEGVEKGFAKLVGTEPQKIYFAVREALQTGCQGQGPNPYGDGFSSQKAWDILTQKGVLI